MLGMNYFKQLLFVWLPSSFPLFLPPSSRPSLLYFTKFNKPPISGAMCFPDNGREGKREEERWSTLSTHRDTEESKSELHLTSSALLEAKSASPTTCSLMDRIRTKVGWDKSPISHCQTACRKMAVNKVCFGIF